jgi:PIN domain nuclease of toxin-antitoxin system
VTLLLDTHAALWGLGEDGRLGAEADRRLSAGDEPVLLSAVVIWEIAIKSSLGKLDAPDDFIEQWSLAGAKPLLVNFEHAAAVRDLPWHHRDPFDRLLVAQAQIESAALVSGDPAMKQYGVPVLW